MGIQEVSKKEVNMPNAKLQTKSVDQDLDTTKTGGACQLSTIGLALELGEARNKANMGRTRLKAYWESFGQIQGHGVGSQQVGGTRYSGKNPEEVGDLVASQLGEGGQLA